MAKRRAYLTSGKIRYDPSSGRVNTSFDGRSKGQKDGRGKGQKEREHFFTARVQNALRKYIASQFPERGVFFPFKTSAMDKYVDFECGAMIDGLCRAVYVVPATEDKKRVILLESETWADCELTRKAKKKKRFWFRCSLHQHRVTLRKGQKTLESRKLSLLKVLEFNERQW